MTQDTSMKQNDVVMRDASTALLKWFLSKIRFCGDIGIFSSKNSTPGRLTLLGVKFLKSKPIKKFTKNVGFCLYSTPGFCFVLHSL